MNDHPLALWLDDYVDGALTPPQTEAMERHLAQCDACQTELAELRSLLQAAKDLGDLAPMPVDVWGSIHDAIHPLNQHQDDHRMPEQPSQAPLPAAPTTSNPGPDNQAQLDHLKRLLWIPLAMAAMGLVVLAWSLPSSKPAKDTPREPVAIQEPSWKTELAAATSDLEQALALKRDVLDPKALAVIENNLQIIDQAIADCERALPEQADDAAMQGILRDRMRAKLSLLKIAHRLKHDS